MSSRQNHHQLHGEADDCTLSNHAKIDTVLLITMCKPRGLLKGMGEKITLRMMYGSYVLPVFYEQKQPDVFFILLRVCILLEKSRLGNARS